MATLAVNYRHRLGGRVKFGFNETYVKYQFQASGPWFNGVGEYEHPGGGAPVFRNQFALGPVGHGAVDRRCREPYKSGYLDETLNAIDMSVRTRRGTCTARGRRPSGLR
jgi:hypothetical protein